MQVTAEISSVGHPSVLGSFYNARGIALSSPDLIHCLLWMMPLLGEREVREEGEFQISAFGPGAPRDSAAGGLTLQF